ncbi:MAG: glycosyltransferase family protein, partial [Alphaproteobacteria bacterium]
CRAIAHALVAENRGLSVLILSGSPIIGNFDFRTRVDFVRVPGVIKLRNGEYTSLSLHLDIELTLAMRASIIEHTADIFDPDLFIVDKEPWGLRGEVSDTLKMLKARGTPLVLGLRDVMDEPALLVPEWERKNVLPALTDLYDEIWVYGLPQLCDPLAEIDLPPSVRKKMRFTGYLRRTVPDHTGPTPGIRVPDEPYLLITPGGGGDGEALIDWVLSAYEARPGNLPTAQFVFGPFMPKARQAAFSRRIEAIENATAITFNARIEPMMAGAAGVVAMGGYNTFCEILSFDKPALIVPRTRPRMEQFIRANRAEEMGLVKMLEDDGTRDPATMATALRQLPQQAKPSTAVVPGLLDGLQSVNRLARRLLDERRAPRVALASQGG